MLTLIINAYVVHFEMYVKYFSEICRFESQLYADVQTQKYV